MMSLAKHYQNNRCTLLVQIHCDHYQSDKITDNTIAGYKVKWILRYDLGFAVAVANIHQKRVTKRCHTPYISPDSTWI